MALLTKMSQLGHYEIIRVCNIFFIKMWLAQTIILHYSWFVMTYCQVLYIGDWINTSTKHGQKELQSFSHCDFFDHHALQSLNNCNYVLLGLPTSPLGISGLAIYCWKGLEYTFPAYITHPKTFNFAFAKWKIKFCSRLVTAYQGGQKNRNGKKIVVLFLPCFLLV